MDDSMHTSPNAVRTSDGSMPSNHISVTDTGSARSSSYNLRYLCPRSSHSSDSRSSLFSRSEPDHGYQTDFTTPATSDCSPEHMQPDDVTDFREREYPYLKGKTYLDHGGTTLYAKSLVDAFANDLVSNLYGNPHSASSPSALSGHRVDTIRERALRFFNADPEHFDLVFVANATAAIKLVTECIRDYAATSNTPVWYGYHRDSHTSVVGGRESTKLHRCFNNDEEVDIWINSGGFGGPRSRQLGLFAYPGQSNMTGRRLPLSWPGRIRKSFHRATTYTLLDAAALASTAPLDLSDPATAPDFVALSFYKIFGFPNIGALIVRKASAHVLQSRRYFGGGTVDMVISMNDTWHATKKTSVHDALEDGTLPFHSIFALDHAIATHERLYGANPMKWISMHTANLGKQLYDGLRRLKHANGVPVCRIYGEERAVYGDPSLQGATVAFNVQCSDGSLVGFAEVEQAADEQSIYVRSGSLCNPGGVATYLDWSPTEMRAAFAAGHRCSSPAQIVFGKATGVVRVSLGAMSTAVDVETLLRFLDEVYVDRSQRARRVEFLPFGQAARSTTRVPQDLIAPLPPPGTARTNFTLDGLQNDDSRPTLDVSTREAPTKSVMWKSDALVSSQHSETVPPLANRTGYTTRRKPWTDASLPPPQHPPNPTVKARKFGRSVVNLLRTKSHFADAKYDDSPGSTRAQQLPYNV